MKKPSIKFNVGISYKGQSIKEEIKKIELGIRYKAEYISHISIEKTALSTMWKAIAAHQNQGSVFASVPLYESVLLNEPLLETIQRQYEYGVRQFVLDCTPRFLIEKANRDPKFHINSRGGYFLTKYYEKNPNKDNPCLENLTQIKAFRKKHSKVSFALAGVLRPGNCASYSLKYLLDELTFYRKHNLLDKNLLEVGGHIKVKDFAKLIPILGKTPVSLMGPLITDTTNKYDHVTNIIGQQLFALQYPHVKGILGISPAEHLYLPTYTDSEQTLIFARMCQHAIGLLYNDPSCVKLEKEFNAKTTSCNIRKNLFGPIEGIKACDMCGSHCPLRNIKK